MMEETNSQIQISEADMIRYLKKHSFKQGSMLWIRDPSQDVEVTDRMNQTRVIKRYVGVNRGKDYRKIKEAKARLDQKNAERKFTIET